MTVQMFLFAGLSLTLVRMIPVAIAMIGTGYKLPEISFMGWFGPRGLASLLFALLILEELNVMQAEFIQTAVATTVLASIVLHGITAAPISRAFGKWADKNSTPV